MFVLRLHSSLLAPDLLLCELAPHNGIFELDLVSITGKCQFLVPSHFTTTDL